MPRMTIEGRMVWPDGVVNPTGVEVVFPAEAEEHLFMSFKEDLKGGAMGFKTEFAVPGGAPPLTVSFVRVGQTAANVAYVHEDNGEFKHLHALGALLSRLDAKEDQLAIDEIKKEAMIKETINPGVIDRTAEGDQPVIITYFVDQPHESQALINTTSKILAAAFFDLLGVADTSA